MKIITKNIVLSGCGVLLGCIIALCSVGIAKKNAPSTTDTFLEETTIITPEETIHIWTDNVEYIKENAYKVFYNSETNISCYYVEGDFHDLGLNGTFVYIEYPEGIKPYFSITPLNVRQTATADGKEVLDMEAVNQGMKALDDALNKITNIEGATYESWNIIWNEKIVKINRLMTAQELSALFDPANGNKPYSVGTTMFIDGIQYAISILSDDVYVISIQITPVPIFTEDDVNNAETVHVETEILPPAAN